MTHHASAGGAALSLILKIQKSWQTADPILVLHFTTRLAGLPKKTFLLVDTRQNHFGLSLARERPERCIPSGPLIALFRKYCRSAVISDILENTTNGDLWLLLHNQPTAAPDYYLCLSKAKPPELSLIAADGFDLIRTGAKGSFTKKKAFPGPFPALGAEFVSRLDSLLAAFIQTNPEAEVPAINLDDPDPEPEAAATTTTDLFSEAQRELVAKLRRKLKTLRRSVDKTSAELPTSATIAAANRFAKLLQQYAYRLYPGLERLELSADETGAEPISVDLDPELSPGQIIEQAFVKAKKTQRAHAAAGAYLAKIQTEQLEIQAMLSELSTQQLSPAAIDAAYSRFHLSRPQTGASTPQIAASQRHHLGKTYSAATGEKILVGRSAAENDSLVKAARAHDWWLHIVGSTGSHVLIPQQSHLRQSLPPPLLREAAILALHHSPLRQDLGGEVYLTRVQKLKKRRGMAPGLWQVISADTHYLRYTQAEADLILSRQLL